MRHTMKKMMVAVMAALAMMAPIRQGMAQERDEDERGLEGTWVVEVSLHNCQTGVAVGAPFLSYLTFARGGTMTETTSNSMFYPADRGPGHGVWSASGHHTYRAASTAFITLNGALVKTQTITQTIVLAKGGDTFSETNAGVQFFSPGGTLLQAGCANAVGTRFELQ